jgi:hypothetical protein
MRYWHPFDAADLAVRSTVPMGTDHLHLLFPLETEHIPQQGAFLCGLQAETREHLLLLWNSSDPSEPHI